MTDQELQEAVEFYKRLKNATTVEFLEWLKAHKHNGNDFPKIDYRDLNNQPTFESFLAPGNPGNVITSNGTSWVSQALSDPSLVTVNAGETLTAGEVVRLYTAVGSRSSDGYDMVNGTVYAVRAAANDTTYGEVYGLAYENMTHLGTGRVKLFGEATLSSLTANTKYYLSNYGASTETITQNTSDSTLNLTSGQTAFQLFVPTSSRLDKVILLLDTNASAQVKVTIRRGNSVLGTVTTTFVGGGAERTFDFTDIRTYKGELLNIHIENDPLGPGGTVALRYKSGTNPYSATYDNGSIAADLSGTGVASGSDLYMKIYEYIDFGKVSSSAGTRKIKIGHSRSTTQLAMQVQYGDSIL